MFEPISQNLELLSKFCIIGFIFGLLYEPFRIIRLFKRQPNFIVCLIDFLFMCFAGLITFAYSMEFGSGTFRLYFVAGEVFGAAIYFLTVGRIISLLSDKIVKLVKYVYRTLKKYILSPLYKLLTKFLQFLRHIFGKAYNFSCNTLIRGKNHLKKRVEIVYNVKSRYTHNTTKKTSGGRNVIKGKIRKKA